MGYIGSPSNKKFNYCFFKRRYPQNITRLLIGKQETRYVDEERIFHGSLLSAEHSLFPFTLFNIQHLNMSEHTLDRSYYYAYIPLSAAYYKSHMSCTVRESFLTPFLIYLTFIADAAFTNAALIIK
jgi:hypothetical protein